MKIKKFLGFEKPYNFPTAIKSLVSISAVFSCLIIALVFNLKDWVHPFSFRFIYLYYLLAIAILSIALVNRRKLYFSILLIFLMELLLGFTSVIFNYNQLDRWLMPMDGQFEFVKPAAFERHSLLQIVPKPNINFELGTSKIKVSHNNLGLRGTNLTKNDFLNKKVIIIHGGSTTYDEGTDQGYTWPEELQKILGNSFLVVNAGVPGYSTVEHLIQATYYDNWYDVKPHCSIYYVGWNDIRNYDIPRLDGGYADFWLPTQFSARPVENVVTQISPTLKAINRIMASAYYAGFPKPKNLTPIKENSFRDTKLESIYRRNLSNIAIVNRNRQIKSVFIPQILNYSELEESTLKDANIYYKNQPRIIQRFNEILRDVSRKANVGFVPIKHSDFSSSDFIDTGHFNKVGSEKMASMIYPDLINKCGF